MKEEEKFGFVDHLFGAIAVSPLVAILVFFIIHVVTCLDEGKIVFLAVGTLIFPIGVAHGFFEIFNYF